MGGSIVEDTDLLTDYIGLTAPSGQSDHETSASRASLFLRGEVPDGQAPDGGAEGDVATERGGDAANSFSTSISLALSVREVTIEDLDTVTVEDGVVAITSQHRGATGSGSTADDTTEVGVLDDRHEALTGIDLLEGFEDVAWS